MSDSIEKKEEYKVNAASNLARMPDIIMCDIDIARLTKIIENFISNNGLDVELESVSSDIASGKTSVAVQVKSDAGFLISRTYVEGFSMEDVEEMIVDDIKKFAKNLSK